MLQNQQLVFLDTHSESGADLSRSSLHQLLGVYLSVSKPLDFFYRISFLDKSCNDQVVQMRELFRCRVTKLFKFLTPCCFGEKTSRLWVVECLIDVFEIRQDAFLSCNDSALFLMLPNK